jgi:hypothetical protein
MKKLMSVLAMVIFMTGMVVAQSNNAEVNQINDYNQATVDQSGNLNKAYVDQTNTKGTDPAYKNQAFVDQVGQENWLDYDVAGYNDVLRSNQVGYDNWAKIDQGSWKDKDNNYNNIVHLDQIGSENHVNALLKGDDNFIQFNQVGHENTVIGASPFKYEGDMSRITIDQTGGENTMKGDIKGSDQFIDVDQMGDNNFSKIEIDAELGVATGVRDQRVTVYQEGMDHRSVVDIQGDHNNVEVRQSVEDQTSTVMIEGDDNRVGHWQPEDGEGNYPYGAHGIYVTHSNFAKSDITGNDNVSYIGKTLGQEGRGNSAIHTITGDDNRAMTDQDGGDNVARITQDGSGNYAKQIQDVWRFESTPGQESKFQNNEADANRSLIDQMGTDNRVKAYQFGDENLINVTQDGSDNKAFIDQGYWDQGRAWGTGSPFIGSQNRAVINQTGTGHISKVNQMGSNNNTVINQQP